MKKHHRENESWIHTKNRTHDHQRSYALREEKRTMHLTSTLSAHLYLLRMRYGKTRPSSNTSWFITPFTATLTPSSTYLWIVSHSSLSLSVRIFHSTLPQVTQNNRFIMNSETVFQQTTMLSIYNCNITFFAR